MTDPNFEPPRYCSQCGGPIVVADAEFCKDCGAALARDRIFVRDPGFSPLLAFLLSVIPGLGHLYKGRVLTAVIWFFVVSVAYTMGPFGLVMHFICAIDAALKGALNGGRLNVRRGARRERHTANSWR